MGSRTTLDKVDGFHGTYRAHADGTPNLLIDPIFAAEENNYLGDSTSDNCLNFLPFFKAALKSMNYK